VLIFQHQLPCPPHSQMPVAVPLHELKANRPLPFKSKPAPYGMTAAL
jgi:hypothetical protein